MDVSVERPRIRSRSIDRALQDDGTPPRLRAHPRMISRQTRCSIFNRRWQRPASTAERHTRSVRHQLGRTPDQISSPSPHLCRRRRQNRPNTAARRPLTAGTRQISGATRLAPRTRRLPIKSRRRLTGSSLRLTEPSDLPIELNPCPTALRRRPRPPTRLLSASLPRCIAVRRLQDPHSRFHRPTRPL
jgi:hypothetical protein